MAPRADLEQACAKAFRVGRSAAAHSPFSVRMLKALWQFPGTIVFAPEKGSFWVASLRGEAKLDIGAQRQGRKNAGSEGALDCRARVAVRTCRQARRRQISHVLLTGQVTTDMALKKVALAGRRA